MQETNTNLYVSNKTHLSLSHLNNIAIFSDQNFQLTRCKFNNACPCLISQIKIYSIKLAYVKLILEYDCSIMIWRLMMMEIWSKWTMNLKSFSTQEEEQEERIFRNFTYSDLQIWKRTSAEIYNSVIYSLYPYLKIQLD